MWIFDHRLVNYHYIWHLLWSDRRTPDPSVTRWLARDSYLMSFIFFFFRLNTNEILVEQNLNWEALHSVIMQHFYFTFGNVNGIYGFQLGWYEKRDDTAGWYHSDVLNCADTSSFVWRQKLEVWWIFLWLAPINILEFLLIWYYALKIVSWMIRFFFLCDYTHHTLTPH